MCLTLAAPAAAPLLCRLFHESLGRSLPMPAVPRFYWYVLEPPTSWRRHVDHTIGVVIGIIKIHGESGKGFLTVGEINIGISYLSICLSLNVILTLMIVARLVFHIRNVRKATGTSGGSSGLHATTAAVATMLIESYAIYAATLLLYIVPFAINSSVLGLFNGLIPTIQVRIISAFPYQLLPQDVTV